MTTPESPVTWIDFHTHVLDSPTLPEDALAARREGVGLWLVNSVDVQNWVQNKARATPYPEALVGVGWHPEHVIQVPVSQVDATLETLEKMIPDAPFLGETGLDFLYGKTVDQQAVQEKVFRRFIHWSNQTGKLLEVHSRHAKQRVIDILVEEEAKHVLLHWFNGSSSQAKILIEKNWVCTVGPTILSSPHIDAFIREMPLASIGLETDAPIPFSGKPGTPALIVEVGARVAALKRVSLAEVQAAQMGLFRRFFP